MATDTYVCNSTQLWAVGTNTNIGAFGAVLLDRTPWDNRMVRIGSDGGDEIRFSYPGDPTNWPTDNWVKPSPGLGINSITTFTASCRWREQLFVFRQGAFFVFTGTSVDSNGNPVFDFRTVDYGVGAVQRYGACSAPEGVYFIAADGVYTTIGGRPQIISSQIDALFKANGPAESQYGTTLVFDATKPVSMDWGAGILYVSVGCTNSTRLLLVYDTRLHTWCVWTIGGRSVATDPFYGLLVAGPTVFGTTQTTDVWGVGTGTGPPLPRGQDFSVGGGALTNFAWSYRTGYDNLGAAGEKMIRRGMIDGTGTITRKFFNELNTGLTYADETVALGSTRTQKWLTKSAKARAFGLQLSGSGDFSVARLEQHVQRLRQPLLDSR